MLYTYPKDGKQYLLNLIDTPGHVDFSYQVSRSIRACEGAILVVDASKGIQAQTLSNFYKAFEADLKIVPVINKIELPAADIPLVEEQLVDQLDFDLEEILYISAKEGRGVDKVFESIIERISPPGGLSHMEDDKEKLEALKCFLFNAQFDPVRGGVACYVKVMSGVFDHSTVRQLFSYHNRKRFEIYQVGILKPKF
jgi:small GTP-binding protein